MSQGIVGKDGIGFAKADVKESRQLSNSFKAVVACHKSPGSESGINLLSLVAPGSDLSGFSQPNMSEIQAARPYMMPGTFRLRSSIRGTLTMYAHFTLVGNQITFTSAFGTSLANELFLIEITPIPANNLMVSDGRQFDTGEFEQLVGVATVTVGYSFTASDFMVVIRNNQILTEGLDFVRVISSNGSGSTLTLTTAPAGANDNMRVYGGIFFGNASVEMFTQLERLAAAVGALATDAALGFYSDTNVARYLSLSPSEMDRLAFGAAVASLQAKLIKPMTMIAISANTGTVASPNAFIFTNVLLDNTGGAYSTVTGKFTVPSAGKWKVSASSIYSNGTNYFALYKNAVKYAMIAQATNGNSTPVLGSGTNIIDCQAGDLLHMGPATGSCALQYIINNYEPNIIFEKVSE